MKIQIDTDSFEIKLEDEKVELEQLFNVLENLLPNGEWKRYALLQTNTILSWTNPIYVEPYKQAYPQQDVWYCGDNNAVNSGIYNFDIGDAITNQNSMITTNDSHLAS